MILRALKGVVTAARLSDFGLRGGCDLEMVVAWGPSVPATAEAYVVVYAFASPFCSNSDLNRWSASKVADCPFSLARLSDLTDWRMSEELRDMPVSERPKGQFHAANFDAWERHSASVPNAHGRVVIHRFFTG